MPELNEAAQTLDGKTQIERILALKESYRKMLAELADCGVPLQDVVKQVRKDYITAALRIANGNKTRASQMIGCHRNSLWRHWKV
jgi:DNA-binding NtrC family response regulator